MEKHLNKIISGDALSVLKTLPDETVDCIITSPPYWGLRDYGVAGQLGMESRVEEYIENLCAIFDQVKRVLKKEGTCFVNLGDTYNQPQKARNKVYGNDAFDTGPAREKTRMPAKGQQEEWQEKCLLQIPSRFAIAMCDRGWILRNEIIWHKPNAMPQSAGDRFTVDFEKIFFFTRSTHYFFDQQQEPASESSIARQRRGMSKDGKWKDGAPGQHGHSMNKPRENDPGREVSTVRNKRAVWTIPTKSFKAAHFAVFPPDLVEVPLLSGCPEYVCIKCGKAREKVIEKIFVAQQDVSLLKNKKGSLKGMDKANSWGEYPRGSNNIKCVGYTDCSCNAEFRPGVVLDPFSGAGTTALVAASFGRNFIGIELNPEFVLLSEQRVSPVQAQQRMPI